MTNDRTNDIATLNDFCRKAVGVGGRLYQTPGIAALPPSDRSTIREKVETFDAFPRENDPYGERDFGAFEYKGHRFRRRSTTTTRAWKKEARTRAIRNARQGFDDHACL